ncbi:hypothetical protein SAMN04488026_11274 [Aliiruegeria lutimaris]|uniref:Uncharacterized protein n=1 Tax=Aliiruegeria lutimaris TaxID=571298 RepID=A0A1G9NS85_9RHOB|nr:hypothetical protein SAMN04488026_11274 [Aliiruegeria lutimaris]
MTAPRSTQLAGPQKPSTPEGMVTQGRKSGSTRQECGYDAKDNSEEWLRVNAKPTHVGEYYRFLYAGWIIRHVLRSDYLRQLLANIIRSASALRYLRLQRSSPTEAARSRVAVIPIRSYERPVLYIASGQRVGTTVDAARAENGGNVGKLAVRSWSAATGPPAPARTAVNCAFQPFMSFRHSAVAAFSRTSLSAHCRHSCKPRRTAGTSPFSRMLRSIRKGSLPTFRTFAAVAVSLADLVWNPTARSKTGPSS